MCIRDRACPVNTAAGMSRVLMTTAADRPKERTRARIVWACEGRLNVGGGNWPRQPPLGLSVPTPVRISNGAFRPAAGRPHRAAMPASFAATAPSHQNGPPSTRFSRTAVSYTHLRAHETPEHLV